MWDGAQWIPMTGSPDGDFLPLAGGTMLGFINLHADPTADAHAATKKYVDDNEVGTEHTVSTNAPVGPNVGDVWVNPDEPPEATYLALAGGTMTGFITLHADPTDALHAATKQYADAVPVGVYLRLDGGNSMTGNIVMRKDNALLSLQAPNGSFGWELLSTATDSATGYLNFQLRTVGSIFRISNTEINFYKDTYMNDNTMREVRNVIGTSTSQMLFIAGSGQDLSLRSALQGAGQNQRLTIEAGTTNTRLIYFMTASGNYSLWFDGGANKWNFAVPPTGTFAVQGSVLAQHGATPDLGDILEDLLDRIEALETP